MRCLLMLALLALVAVGCEKKAEYAKSSPTIDPKEVQIIGAGSSPNTAAPTPTK